MPWPQNYDPLHAWQLSTAGLGSACRLALRGAHRVQDSGLGGCALRVFWWPLSSHSSSSACRLPWWPPRRAHGVVFGLIRIAWIIVASLFLYQVAVETGQFQVMKESIAALSTDKRIQLILVAFCFGAFLEGTGGGGAPVAIAGSFLIGLGFEPFQAATLCLLANTAPVAWGGVGTPIRVLSGVTGFSETVLERDDRANPAARLGDPSALAGSQHGRLAADA